MPAWLRSLILKPLPDLPTIYIVSGLPRSGTSLMQQMLAVGGIEPLTDRIRGADESNPNGYFEFERVKGLKDGDNDWLESAIGKSVKVISFLLKDLPDRYQYRILFMQREMGEILASQKKMLAERGEPTDKVSDAEMARLYQEHLDQALRWLKRQPNMHAFYIPYVDLMIDPIPILERVNRFLDQRLDIAAMAKIVDPRLYRQRKPFR